jgi:putative membrane-bound dehydrogenase-like protein
MTFVSLVAALLLLSQHDSGVLPKGDDGRTLNLDFEAGDLRDWKTEGQAFQGQPIEGDVVASRRADMKSRHQGRFWLGGWEKGGDRPTGTITSVPFTVTHTFASFLIGGGGHNNTVVQLVRADTGREIFQASGMEQEDMQRVLVDLFAHRGKQIFIRIVDSHRGHWGHVNFDDFRFHDKRPNVPERKGTKLDSFQHAGLDPEAAARAMTVPEGFEVKLFAAEPDVTQPIAFCIDDRGRLWVVENHTYPNKSSQPMYLKDGQKPTFGKGKDRILIFEDVDGDGKHDKRTVFYEGLEMASGIEYGFGGVFVGAAPYLLHIPDKNGDDKPDGEPVVLLDGWGSEDTHETLNSFKWGPDGWLYGCHGVFTHSWPGAPGTAKKDRMRINAGIWRYHPTKKKAELFAEGTSNPWGVDFNENGDCFLVCCVIPHLFHVFPGGRFDRQAGSHFNPYTYDDIQTIAKHRHWVGSTPHAGNNRSDEAGGGHAHSGCMIYQGGTWPKQYHGKIFMNNIHGARLNVDVVTPKGSGYEGDRQPDFLKANDSWSQIISLQYGPDGNVYMIDWYDANQCHRVNPKDHDARNGRIFKVVWKGKPDYEPDEPRTVEFLDKVKNKLTANNGRFAALDYIELLSLQSHPNAFWSSHAARAASEKAAAAELTGDDLDLTKRIVLATPQSLPASTHRFLAFFEHVGVYSLVMGREATPFDGQVGRQPTQFDGQLPPPDKDDSFVLRMSASNQVLLPKLLTSKHLKTRADSTNPRNRLAVATVLGKGDTAARFSTLPILLSHGEDASDHNLPMMYWYAAEPLAAVDPSKALDLALNGKIPRIWEFMARRIAAIESADASAVLAAGLVKHDDPAKQKAVLRGMNFTLQGRRNVTAPKGWAEAVSPLLKSSDAETRSLAMSLSAKFGDPGAMATLRQIVVDRNVGVDERTSALSTLVGARDKELPPTLFALIFDADLRKPAIQALGAFSDPKTPEVLIAAYSALPADEKKDVLSALASREPFAMALIEAVGAKKIAGTDVSADIIRQLRNLQSAALDKRLADVWGVARETSADKAKLIGKFKETVTRGYQTPPDLSLGRAMFKKHCGNCHTLFDDGAKTAPELTGSNRRDLDYVLTNVVDPNAIIGKDYLAHRIQMADGRVLTAIIKSQTDKTMTIITATETITIPKSDVERMQESKESLMPEKLLEPLSEHELRSLVRYLASPQQVPLPAGFKMEEKK